VEASSPSPVAVAEIPLDEEERKRIARDLGLDESQLDSVPKKLDIARFEDQEVGDDVSGFLFNSLQLASPTPQQLSQPATSFQVGRIPGGILVAQ
jgi:hypothetical protein